MKHAKRWTPYILVTALWGCPIEAHEKGADEQDEPEQRDNDAAEESDQAVSDEGTPSEYDQAKPEDEGLVVSTRCEHDVRATCAKEGLEEKTCSALIAEKCASVTEPPFECLAEGTYHICIKVGNDPEACEALATHVSCEPPQIPGDEQCLIPISEQCETLSHEECLALAQKYCDTSPRHCYEDALEACEALAHPLDCEAAAREKCSPFVPPLADCYEQVLADCREFKLDEDCEGLAKAKCESETTEPIACEDATLQECEINKLSPEECKLLVAKNCPPPASKPVDECLGTHQDPKECADLPSGAKP